MKIRPGATIVALAAAAILMLSGCVPGALLPQRPVAVPMPQATFMPDHGGGGESDDGGNDWEDGGDDGVDDDHVADVITDDDTLYSWVSESVDSPWVVTVDVDLNAFAMIVDDDMMMILIGDAALADTSVVITLSPTSAIIGPGSPGDTYTLTIDNVDAESTTMRVSKNGAELPSVDVLSVTDM